MEGKLEVTNAQLVEDFKAILGLDEDVMLEPGPEWRTVSEIWREIRASGRPVGETKLRARLEAAAENGILEKRLGVDRKTRRVVTMYRIPRDE